MGRIAKDSMGWTPLQVKRLPTHSSMREVSELIYETCKAYLIQQGVLDLEHSDTIGLVIETQCNYFAPLAFPHTVEAGIRVARLGGSSVRYEVGLFAQGEPRTAAAGHFIHVYVDRETRRPVAVPDALRNVLQALVMPG